MLRPYDVRFRARIGSAAWISGFLRPYDARVGADIGPRSRITNHHDPMHVIRHDNERVDREVREMIGDRDPRSAHRPSERRHPQTPRRDISE